MAKNTHSPITFWLMVLIYSLFAIIMAAVCIDAIIDGEYIFILVLLGLPLILYLLFVRLMEYKDTLSPKDSGFFCGVPYDFAYTIAERGQKLYFQIIRGQNKNNSEIEVSLLAVEDADVPLEQIKNRRALVIPSSVTLRDQTYIVREIDHNAYFKITGLYSVTIPNTVTRIGDYSFAIHTGLSSIILEEGNPVYDSRDSCNAIIHTKTNKLVAICQNTVVPDSVVGWRDGCFNREALNVFKSIYPDKESFRYHYLKGKLHYAINQRSEGQLKAAVAEFEKCLEVEPENTDVLLDLGFLHSYFFKPTYDYEKSLKYYTQAMSLCSEESNKNNIQFCIDQLNAYNKGEYDNVPWIGVQFWDDSLNE